MAKDGATGAKDLADLVAKLDAPRAVWVMLPAGGPTEETVAELGGLLAKDDIVIDGGNTFYRDDIRRAKALAPKGIIYVDVGTSGGVWGLERGFCMMVGGEKAAGRPARSDPEDAGAGPRRHPAHQAAGRRRSAAPSSATSTPAPPAPATSSRWSTTASSTG